MLALPWRRSGERQAPAVRALSVPERVTGQHGCPTRDQAIAGDHAVELQGVEEVVVNAVADLRLRVKGDCPPASRRIACCGSCRPQVASAYGAMRSFVIQVLQRGIGRCAESRLEHETP